MKLHEEFKLFETMWDTLTESKADIQKLINFAGEDLTNKFLSIKNKLKAPESDLYYWIKGSTPEEFETFLHNIEQKKSNTQLKKEVAGQGAKLVCSTTHWDVYNITTYEAAQSYGRDTKWCITGINNWGDFYWQEHKYKRGTDFYFLITKGKYNPRATDCKYAIEIYPDGETYEAFDQQNTQILIEDIKYIDEVKIPGVDLWSLESRGEHCSVCNDYVFNEEGRYDFDDNLYCPLCWNDRLHEWVDASQRKITPTRKVTLYSSTDPTVCDGCGQVVEKPYDKFDKPFSLVNGHKLCSECLTDWIKLPDGFIDKVILIGCYNYDNFDILVDDLKLTQQDVDEIIAKWQQLKKAGQLSKLSAPRIKEIEELFAETIDQLSLDASTIELKEWLDSNGKKINSNSKAATAEGPYKKRFEKLIKYHIDHASSELESVTTKDIKDYSFHLSEHYNTGSQEFDRTIIVSVNKYTDEFYLSIFVDGKAVYQNDYEGYDKVLEILTGTYMFLPDEGTQEYGDLLVEWIDATGQKVNSNNSSTTQTARNKTYSKSNKEKFEELTNYMKNNRGTTAIKSDIVRVDDHGFTYKEHWAATVSALGEAYVLTVLVGYSRFNSAWRFELYMDTTLIKEMKGSGMEDLLVELGHYFRVPKAGSMEYKSLTESALITDNFKEYKNL